MPYLTIKSTFGAKKLISNFYNTQKINHLTENTKSFQLIKSVLEDSSKAAYQGKIFVNSKHFQLVGNLFLQKLEKR